MRKSKPAAVVPLGIAQTLAWASSYYLLAILADPIARDTGLTSRTVFAAVFGSASNFGADRPNGKAAADVRLAAGMVRSRPIAAPVNKLTIRAFHVSADHGKCEHGKQPPGIFSAAAFPRIFSIFWPYCAIPKSY